MVPTRIVQRLSPALVFLEIPHTVTYVFKVKVPLDRRRWWIETCIWRTRLRSKLVVGYSLTQKALARLLQTQEIGPLFAEGITRLLRVSFPPAQRTNLVAVKRPV
jgi:hypothetical protein